jgi:hypothetical protein
LSSDRDGIFNLFAWDPAGGRVDRITNVLGGAFSPAPSPDGKRLAFVAYTARGYDVHVMELGSAAAPADGLVPSGPDASRLLPGAAGETEPPPLASRPYSPLGTLAPRLWVPWSAVSPASGTLVGLLTGGQDVLQRHAYTLTVLYGPDDGRLMHAARYAYTGARPTLRLLSWDVDRTYAALLHDARGSADYTERSRAIGVDASLEFPGLETSTALALGYRWRELAPLTPLAPWPGYGGETPATGHLGSSRLSWSYASAHRQAFSVSPEDGQRIELGLERAQQGLGADRSFTTFTLDWQGYAALAGSRQVLAARLFVGGSTGETPPQGAFSLGGDAPGDIARTVDDRMLSLRGYPLNAFRGARAALAGLEYRFPLLQIGRGADTAPFFLRRLHGALFVDAGEAWDEGGFAPGALKAGIGAELRLDLTFSYLLPLTVRLGVAAGLDEQGGVYPTLGVTMQEGLLATPAATRGR